MAISGMDRAAATRHNAAAAEPTMPGPANSEDDTSTTTQTQMWKVVVESIEKKLLFG